ncbi:Set1C component SDC1 (Suppressor of CDC25 protein 1) [Scheffersomyces stipitis CBS 6054]|uniref:Set1C component SDC1 (Suppressor of CDC25 protein 1) n=1 Tax=Scheffersomyces stipitis (strain ATCC 58785 / CBS 6054 / NBRC 10063 / NRRL Y-11545) TaxID=322104 RepID=A3LVJ8_PICST|nr:Set1C component SDC1 (Suppressor of CDC25 protein 1) [Scheffersomyces stipitis CBS 6054]ABN66789.1 Set1C component SDC1 (Suppressor of CDC25 protein 1) [Scheffersomyces stipitis CBS 6054]KAG2734739.1 hypothetical protein G9P44_002745 [Scheffersomyces stipitis]
MGDETPVTAIAAEVEQTNTLGSVAIANGDSTDKLSIQALTSTTEPEVKSETEPEAISNSTIPAIASIATAVPDNKASSPTPTAKRPKLQSREASVDLEALRNDGPPVHEIVGGSSVRRYLNEHVTRHLLEGLKEVGSSKPEDPLQYLGEFLLQRAAEERSRKK